MQAADMAEQGVPEAQPAAPAPEVQPEVSAALPDSAPAADLFVAETEARPADMDALAAAQPQDEAAAAQPDGVPAIAAEPLAVAPAAVLDDVAHIASTDAVPPPSDVLLSLEAKLRAQELELVQLRAAVLAARGSRGVLPPGWDDAAPQEQAESHIDAEEEAAPLEREQEIAESSNAAEAGAAKQDGVNVAAPSADETSATDDAAARSMLNRALVSLGEAPLSTSAPAAVASSDSSSSDSDSSDSDSDSDSSDSSSSSGSQAAGTKKRARVALSDDDSDDEATRNGPRDPFAGPTTANEAIEPPPEPLPFERVPDHVELRPLGHVLSIVDSVVIVAQDVKRKQPGSEGQQQQRERPRDQEGREGEGEGEYSVLDSGSTLAFEDRTALGVVYETFGSVLAPLYSLRFKSADDVQRAGVTIGRAVMYDPASSVYVLTRQLRQEKGSDASNLHDEEVDVHERDFSDDEAEAAARQARKKNTAAGKKRGEKRRAADGAEGGAPQRGNGRIGSGLPTRPDFDAPLGNGGGPSRPEGRALPLPYDESGAWTPPAPSASAVSGLPQRVAQGLSAHAERTASQSPSNGAVKAGLPLSRPGAGLPAKPQVTWDTPEPAAASSSSAGASSSATTSAAPMQQAQLPQPPPIFLTGEAPPPGAHINPLFAHQWQQQAQTQAGGAYPYAAPHAQQQPYHAQAQQWMQPQARQQQWGQNYGQYGQHAAAPQPQQQAWGWNPAQQQHSQAQGQQQEYAAYDPQQPSTQQWGGAASWTHAQQGTPQQPRPSQ